MKRCRVGDDSTSDKVQKVKDEYNTKFWTIYKAMVTSLEEQKKDKKASIEETNTLIEINSKLEECNRKLEINLRETKATETHLRDQNNKLAIQASESSHLLKLALETNSDLQMQNNVLLTKWEIETKKSAFFMLKKAQSETLCQTEDYTRKCVVCWEHERNIAFDRCNHFVLCNSCSEFQKTCPICNDGIEKGIRMLYIS